MTQEAERVVLRRQAEAEERAGGCFGAWAWQGEAGTHHDAPCAVLRCGDGWVAANGALGDSWGCGPTQ